MKYVLIFVVVVFLARIDIVVNVISKLIDKNTSPKTNELIPSELVPGQDLVPFSEDLSFKSNPRKIFLTMIGSHQASSNKELLVKTIDFLQKNPTILSNQLDLELESTLYKWRDLLVQKDKLTYEFLIELIKNIKGENLEMLKRLFSLVMDRDTQEFIFLYHKLDPQCQIGSYLVDDLPAEEAFNELSQRISNFEFFLKKDGNDLSQSQFAERCVEIIRIKRDNLQTVSKALNSSQEGAFMENPEQEIPLPESPINPSSPQSTP